MNKSKASSNRNAKAIIVGLFEYFLWVHSTLWYILTAYNPINLTGGEYANN